MRTNDHSGQIDCSVCKRRAITTETIASLRFTTTRTAVVSAIHTRKFSYLELVVFNFYIKSDAGGSFLISFSASIKK